MVAALTVAELSARTGVPVSTIHHYRQRGLLPPPIEADGRRLRYGGQHVRALRLIRRLRERRGLSLERIAEILPQLLASQHEAFRPSMWDRLLSARASADPTLAAIIDTAIAELARRPFADVTVADICAAAGVGKGTFYRYFDSKEAAFVAAAEAAADRVAAAVRAAEGGELATTALHHALAPMLPLFLELATLSSRGAPPFLTAAPDVFGRIAVAIGERCGDPGAAIALFAQAATDLVRDTINVTPRSR